MNHSSYANMVQVASRLSGDLLPVYNIHFKQGRSSAEICTTLGITPDEFLNRKTRVLRTLRGSSRIQGVAA